MGRKQPEWAHKLMTRILNALEKLHKLNRILIALHAQIQIFVNDSNFAKGQEKTINHRMCAIISDK